MNQVKRKNTVGAPISDAQQLKAGLKAFFSITDVWGVTREQRKILLGNPGNTLYSEWKVGKVKERTVSTDLLDRLSYILGIYKALKILHSPENQVRFLKNPTKVVPFSNMSPLEYMLSGHLVALSDVRRYLDLHRGR